MTAYSVSQKTSNFSWKFLSTLSRCIALYTVSTQKSRLDEILTYGNIMTVGVGMIENRKVFMD